MQFIMTSWHLQHLGICIQSRCGCQTNWISQFTLVFIVLGYLSTVSTCSDTSIILHLVLLSSYLILIPRSNFATYIRDTPQTHTKPIINKYKYKNINPAVHTLLLITQIQAGQIFPHQHIGIVFSIIMSFCLDFF